MKVNIGWLCSAGAILFLLMLFGPCLTAATNVPKPQPTRPTQALRSEHEEQRSVQELHSFADRQLKRLTQQQRLELQRTIQARHDEQSTVARAAEKGHDSASEASEMSETVATNLQRLSSQVEPKHDGRCICIAITGVDSRMGVAQRHADANHILRIWPQSACMEIISVPRGTAADAGLHTEALNYLANVRANRGREVYLQSLAHIAGVKHIDYWVELGFSQAIGLMEMLGFKNTSTDALHVLRTRKAFAVGDYQRCYNQGQFMRQAILNNFNKSTGFIGSVALRSALGLVETNLSYDAARAIIDELSRNHFPAGSDAVSVRLRPTFKAALRELNLTDAAAIANVNIALNTTLKKNGFISKSISPAFDADRYERSLLSKIRSAERDYTEKPQKSINTLRLVFKQRSWIQIPDAARRLDYMRRICTTLTQSYESLGFAIEADNVRSFYEQQVKDSPTLLGGLGPTSP